jgi:hypothetical protein
MSLNDLRKFINIIEGYDEAYLNHRNEMKSLADNGYEKRGHGAGNDKSGETGYWFAKSLRDKNSTRGRYYTGSIMFKHNNYTRINDQVRAKIEYEDYAYTEHSTGKKLVDQQVFDSINDAIKWTNQKLAEYNS